MDIYQLCSDEKRATSAQFYNSAITVISVLIGSQLLLFCACLVMLRRASFHEIQMQEHTDNRKILTANKAWVSMNRMDKMKAICMHGIISTKGYFSVAQFRQVFLIALAPAR